MHSRNLSNLARSFTTPLRLVTFAGKMPLVAIASMGITAAAWAQPGAANPPAAPAPAKADAKSAPKVKMSDQNLVDMHVKDEQIVNVLELLHIQSGKNIIASKNVSGKISADLIGVTLYEALDSILHVNGYTYTEKGNFIYVYTVEEFEKIQKASKPRVGKVIRLNYINAVDAAEFVKPLLSQGADVKTTSKTEDYKMPDTGPAGKDDFALGAVIVVIDYEENLKAVEKLIAELDTKPMQVLVEATVMQTKVDESNAFGIDFSIIGDVNFSQFATIGGPRAVADALGLGGNGTTGGLSPSNDNAFGIQSGPGKTAGKSTLKVGVISKNLALILKLLDEVTDTTVMANPKLLVLNRQPARVQVIDRLAYISTTQTETSQTQTVQFLDTGVQLYFRPFVSNTGEIRMELKPQVSTGTTKEIKGTGGATVTVPDESRQEITTNVIVQDGQTVVLGGLFRESTVASRSQVPLFGDIPIFGTPFRGHDDNTKREEIIFLVTSNIVNDKVLLSQSERAVDTIERVRAGTRQGILPWSRDKITASLNVEAEHFARAGEFDKALWKLRTSLRLNPRQPDALRLQERLTGERELWPTRNMLSDIINEDAASKFNDIKTITPAPKLDTLEGQFDIPRVPANIKNKAAFTMPNFMNDATFTNTTFSDPAHNADAASTFNTNTIAPFAPANTDSAAPATQKTVQPASTQQGQQSANVPVSAAPAAKAVAPIAKANVVPAKPLPAAATQQASETQPQTVQPASNVANVDTSK